MLTRFWQVLQSYNSRSSSMSTAAQMKLEVMCCCPDIPTEILDLIFEKMLRKYLDPSKPFKLIANFGNHAYKGSPLHIHYRFIIPGAVDFLGNDDILVCDDRGIVVISKRQGYHFEKIAVDAGPQDIVVVDNTTVVVGCSNYFIILNPQQNWEITKKIDYAKDTTGPGSIAIGPDGRIYVGESGSNRVSVFSKTGEYLTKIKADKPDIVAVNPVNGNIWIGNHNPTSILICNQKSGAVQVQNFSDEMKETSFPVSELYDFTVDAKGQGIFPFANLCRIFLTDPNFKVIASIPMYERPTCVAVSPSGKLAVTSGGSLMLFEQ